MSKRHQPRQQPPFTIRSRWDHSKVPTGSATERGLLLGIKAEEAEISTSKKRPAVNLAIVIDRSGSMSGGPLKAAKTAAMGISQRLRKHDRLSIICYDDEVQVLIDGARQNSAGRASTQNAIRSIRTRGCTNLAGGWLEGARCVAEVMEHKGHGSGHVILLSDGLANRGETDAEILAGLSGDLAERGVTSTCVGIGERYSPLQLGAIADAGQGEMHHSNEPEEIIEVLLGELGEVTRLVARNFSVTLEVPQGIKLRQLTRYRSPPGGDNNAYHIGNLVGGQKRHLALLAEIPEQDDPATLQFACTVNWEDAEDNTRENRVKRKFKLTVVDPRDYDKKRRNKRVARTIAEIWMARHGYDAMVLNEQGRYGEAVDLLDQDLASFSSLIRGLEEERSMLRKRRAVRESTSREWSGISKMEALSMSAKMMRSKPDHRSAREDSDWTDFQND